MAKDKCKIEQVEEEMQEEEDNEAISWYVLAFAKGLQDPLNV